MVTGIPAETLGQNAAGISLDSVKKTGNIKENIQEVVLRSEMTEPTNSCGQASNEVCDLLLGIESASEFEKANYHILSDDGINLKDSLSDKNSLIRVEIDRYNAPNTYKVISRNKFNPENAERNKVYLLEDQLLYLTEAGKVMDLDQSPELCKELFDTLITSSLYSHYPLDDGYMEASDGPEEEAICKINELFVTKSENLDCWRATHSFTILVPQAEEGASRTLYPYQAYWTKHSKVDPIDETVKP